MRSPSDRQRLGARLDAVRSVTTSASRVERALRVAVGSSVRRLSAAEPPARGGVAVERRLVERHAEAGPVRHAHLAAGVVERLDDQVVLQHDVAEQLHGVAEHGGARGADVHLRGRGDAERLVVQDGAHAAARRVVDGAQRLRDAAGALGVDAEDAAPRRARAAR